MSIHTVTSSDSHYVSPILGNGEVVTMFGPTGYHGGYCPELERINRTIVWAGRRMDTPTNALIRFGQLHRELTSNGIRSTDGKWWQSLDYDKGLLISTLDHSSIQEQTTSLVAFTENILIFHTTLHNQSSQPMDVDYRLTYQINDTIDNNLDFPYMSHFEFRDDIAQDQPVQLALRPKWNPDGMSILYHINRQIGEVRIGWHPTGQMSVSSNGGVFHHKIQLQPDEKRDFWFWVMLSDRRKFTHFPNIERVHQLVNTHDNGWQDFWSQSVIEFADKRITDFRQSCLYTIRCNASPWSIPPAYLPRYWEGRTFHDELYPYLALLSSGYTDLARRIPLFRLNTLPTALHYGGGRSARYPWEALETGEEGGPYGPWMDERFHIGQFSEAAWRLYLYVRDADVLRQLYPLLRGCAELFVHDVLIRDDQGVLKTRLVTDFDEAIYPVDNGIFTLCAAIRTLESATYAAELLDVDTTDREQWRLLATELRDILPQDEYYLVADNAHHWHIAQMGPIYPFFIDVNSSVAKETLTRLRETLKTDLNLKPGSATSYEGSHWMWCAALLATGYFHQGRGDEGYALLKSVLNSSSPFLSSNEQCHTRLDTDPAHKYILPWFTTSAGAVVYAMNSQFVQVDDEGTILLYGVSSELKNVRFEKLQASHGIRVSGELHDGKLIRLQLHAPRSVDWTFCIPESYAKQLTLSGKKHGRDLAKITVSLSEGTTDLV